MFRVPEFLGFLRYIFCNNEKLSLESHNQRSQPSSGTMGNSSKKKKKKNEARQKLGRLIGDDE